MTERKPNPIWAPRVVVRRVVILILVSIPVAAGGYVAHDVVGLDALGVVLVMIGVAGIADFFIVRNCVR